MSGVSTCSLNANIYLLKDFRSVQLYFWSIRRIWNRWCRFALDFTKKTTHIQRAWPWHYNIWHEAVKFQIKYSSFFRWKKSERRRIKQAKNQYCKKAEMFRTPLERSIRFRFHTKYTLLIIFREQRWNKKNRIIKSEEKKSPKIVTFHVVVDFHNGWLQNQNIHLICQICVFAWNDELKYCYHTRPFLWQKNAATSQSCEKENRFSVEYRQ